MKNQTICIALFLLLGISCGKEERKVRRSIRDIEISKVFVKGNPQTIVKGAELNKLSFFHVDQLGKFDQYYLSSAREYTQVGDKNPEDYIDWAYSAVKEGQEPPAYDLTNNFAPEKYNFMPAGFYGSDKIYYEYRRQNGSRKMPLVFTREGDYLTLAGVAVSNNRYFSMEVIHYSMKDDESAFSILAHGDDPKYGNVMVAFYFTKDFELSNPISYGDTDYNYLYGPGVKVSWDKDQPLKINLCGFPRQKLAENSIKVWDDALDNRLVIETMVLENYPPFSDLNVHCVYMIDNYRTISSNTSCNPASASTIPNLSNGELVDADIFFWQQELEKYVYDWPQNRIDQFLSKVFIHEVGHSLGLHHNFSGTQSIMSYDSDNDPMLYVYDLQAIRELYN